MLFSKPSQPCSCCFPSSPSLVEQRAFFSSAVSGSNSGWRVPENGKALPVKMKLAGWRDLLEQGWTAGLGPKETWLSRVSQQRACIAPWVFALPFWLLCLILKAEWFGKQCQQVYSSLQLRETLHRQILIAIFSKQAQGGSCSSFTSFPHT